ncbi:MAG: calcium-binding protein, partial [Pseudomonadota bacterium]
MQAGDGADVFFASRADSYFDGGDGYDLVNFHFDAQNIDGGDSSLRGLRLDMTDTSGPGGTIAATAVQGDFTFILENIEGVVGTRTDDLIIGDDGDNALFGVTGQDTLIGGGGDDVFDTDGLVRGDLQGGTGNDVFFLGYSTGGRVAGVDIDTTVDGGAGVDTADLARSEVYRLDTFCETGAERFNGLELAGGWTLDLEDGLATADFEDSNRSIVTSRAVLSDIENVFGAAFEDTISGSDEDNAISGREGDDILEGRGGNDALDGGTGSDMVDGGAGDDFITGGAGEATPVAVEYASDFSRGDQFGETSSFGSIDGWDSTVALFNFDVYGTGAEGLSEELGPAIELDTSDRTMSFGRGPDGITQDFDLVEGETYRISFTLINNPGTDANGDPFAFDDAGQGAQLYVDDTLITDLEVWGPEPGSSTGEFVTAAGQDVAATYAYEFTATGEEDVIIALTEVWRLTDENGNNVYQDSDGVGPLVTDIQLEALGQVDTMTGGEGDDIFALSDGGGADIITDFTVGEDRLSLVEFNAGFEDLEITAAPDESGTEIRVEDQLVGRLYGVAPASLSRADFLFVKPGAEISELGSAEGEVLGAQAGDGYTTGLTWTVEALGGDDTVLGGDQPDGLNLGDGDDSAGGGDGDDSLRGGEGDDTMTGGAGRDAFLFGAEEPGQDEILDFTDGEDLIVIDGLTFGDGPEDTDPEAFLAEHAIFDGADLVIDLGVEQSVRLVGLSDPDDPEREVTDFASALGNPPAGDDTLNGADDDGLDEDGTEGADLLEGTTGDDSLEGFEGNDTITGGPGEDTLIGGANADSITGGADDDVIRGNHGKDALFGGDGDDNIRDWSGWSLLDGGAGDDVLQAGAGRDTLIGGTGDDTMTGGSKADKFVFGEGDGEDQITDFSPDEDKLIFEGVTFGEEEG